MIVIGLHLRICSIMYCSRYTIVGLVFLELKGDEKTTLFKYFESSIVKCKVHMLTRQKFNYLFNCFHLSLPSNVN